MAFTESSNFFDYGNTFKDIGKFSSDAIQQATLLTGISTKTRGELTLLLSQLKKAKCSKQVKQNKPKAAHKISENDIYQQHILPLMQQKMNDIDDNNMETNEFQWEINFNYIREMGTTRTFAGLRSLHDKICKA